MNACRLWPSTGKKRGARHSQTNVRPLSNTPGLGDTLKPDLSEISWKFNG